MALKKYIVDLLQDNPLNGISTYKDVLTLSTGAINRKIKKLVLTGQETIILNGKYDASEILQVYYKLPLIGTTTATNIICSHLKTLGNPSLTSSSEGITMRANGTDMIFGISFAAINVSVSDSTAVALTKLMAYLTHQYTNGTPVTVWYVMATDTTEQVTVPTGLSGTVDGYTIQSSTPTPTNPIYPTANTVTMWANYTPQRYNGIAFVTATGQPEQYNGGWS